MAALSDLFSLQGKVALVTGGSRGLGLSMAEALGEAGAKIAIAARHQEELDAAKAQLLANGIETIAVSCNLGQTDLHAQWGLVEAVLARWGQLDVLVNNAGTGWKEPAETHSYDGWLKTARLNMDAAFLLSQKAAALSMIPRRQGKIVNIGSISGMGGHPPRSSLKSVAYNATKGGIINMTKALSCEWGRYNINVNAISPGFFATELSREALKNLESDTIEQTPLGRIGGEHDLKGIVTFLATDASRHVTGQNIAVDGGISAVY